VKVARCFVIRELRGALGSAQECSGAYFSKTYEHGPESWTHKWTHVKPGWHPVFFRLASHFGGDSLANYCGLVSSARWQLDHFNCPKSVTTHRSILGCFWQQVSDGFHGQKADIRAPASASSQARQRKMRVLGEREPGGGEGGIRLPSSSASADEHYTWHIIPRVCAGYKRIRS